MNKDKVTNIAGLVIFLAGALIAGDKAGQIHLGETIDGILSLVVTVGTGLVAWYTGKKSQ